MTIHTTINANAKLMGQPEFAGSVIIHSLFGRLYSMTGFSQQSMRIRMSSAPVDDEMQALGEISGPNAVTEKSEFGNLNDMSNVTKFDITNEDDDQRQGTFR
jgi:hypothetical protein